MQQHRPHGPAPTALEANVLKLRAFEMILIVFYIEDLKRFIIRSVACTNKILKKSPSPADAENDELGSKALKQAMKVLINAGALTTDQRTELSNLIAYRNTIGHEPHFLTVDVGAYEHMAEFITVGKKNSSGYDGTILDRVVRMRQHLHKAMAKNFMMSLSPNYLMFEAAEKSYLSEIKRLKAKISSQFNKLESQIDEADESIRKIQKKVMDEIQPYHPKHFKRNGTLSPSGIASVKRLYSEGATPLAVSHIMKISIVAARRWR